MHFLPASRVPSLCLDILMTPVNNAMSTLTNIEFFNKEYINEFTNAMTTIIKSHDKREEI
jgi:hypothetical protein